VTRHRPREPLHHHLPRPHIPPHRPLRLWKHQPPPPPRWPRLGGAAIAPLTTSPASRPAAVQTRMTELTGGTCRHPRQQAEWLTTPRIVSAAAAHPPTAASRTSLRWQLPAASSQCLGQSPPTRQIARRRRLRKRRCHRRSVAPLSDAHVSPPPPPPLMASHLRCRPLAPTGALTCHPSQSLPRRPSRHRPRQ